MDGMIDLTAPRCMVDAETRRPKAGNGQQRVSKQGTSIVGGG